MDIDETTNDVPTSKGATAPPFHRRLAIPWHGAQHGLHRGSA